MVRTFPPPWQQSPLPTLVLETLLDPSSPAHSCLQGGPAMGLFRPHSSQFLFQQPEQFNGQNNTFSGSSYSSYSQGSVNRVSVILVFRSPADPQQVSAGSSTPYLPAPASLHGCKGPQVEDALPGHLLRHRYVQDLGSAALLGDQGEVWALQKTRQRKDPGDWDSSCPAPAGTGNVA